MIITNTPDCQLLSPIEMDKAGFQRFSSADTPMRAASLHFQIASDNTPHQPRHQISAAGHYAFHQMFSSLSAY
jgi:hypothetical protein